MQVELNFKMLTTAERKRLSDPRPAHRLNIKLVETNLNRGRVKINREGLEEKTKNSHPKKNKIKKTKTNMENLLGDQKRVTIML